MDELHMKIFENPSFKMVPFFDPLDVILKNTPDEEKFLKAMKPMGVWKIGKVLKDGSFKVYGFEGKVIIDSDIRKLKLAWQDPFKEM